MPSPADIQDYLRAAAFRQYETVSVPPFTLFFHPTDPLPFFNYAIPDRPVGARDGVERALERVRAEFALRQRTPRFEFVEGYSRDLADGLSAAGFVPESRSLLMACGRPDFRPAAAVPGLTWCVLSAASSLGDLRFFLILQREAFGMPGGPDIGEADARWLRRGFGKGQAFVGFHEGRPVATALFTDPIGGIAEVAGVATLPGYRRRGIGTALTSEAVRTAFEVGAQTAVLAAADEAAGRVYERVGFRAQEHALSFRAAGDGGAAETL